MSGVLGLGPRDGCESVCIVAQPAHDREPACDLLERPVGRREDWGRRRHIAVGIEGSVYLALETRLLVAESLDQVLVTAAAIPDRLLRALFAAL
jgi:hypothetical protein